MPPNQNSPWTAPVANLPSNFVSAAATLFEQGLADPRGCEYREINVGTGNVWTGDGGVVTTHGWVLPSTNIGRFAICWNGLVYPVASVGTNVNFDSEAATMVADKANNWRTAVPEAMAISPAYRNGIKACLLWRLGKADLAAEYWANLQRQNAGSDPYLEWATSWAWAMFDRLLCAHMRGDEALALVTARQLSQTQPRIEEECFRRGFREPLVTGVWHSPGMVVPLNRPYLNFLGQLPAILADLERREKEGERESIATDDLKKFTNQSERIGTLIRDFDLVDSRQMGQPGGVDLSGNRFVSALVAEGDAAVEPLLNSLEKDTRLTRSVRFGRDFGMDRKVMSVADAALDALEGILHLQLSYASTPQSNLGAIRAYWDRNKGMKLEDRWYVALKDDSAADGWREAAANITAPANWGSHGAAWVYNARIPRDQSTPMSGESLRAKSNPTVTELLTKRALEVPSSNLERYDTSTACEIGLCLMAWDPKAALPVAKTLVKRVSNLINYSSGTDHTRNSAGEMQRNQLQTYTAALLLGCVGTGETDSFRDYAAWVKTTIPGRDAYNWKQWLEPLQLYRTNDAMRLAAEALFDDLNSPWSHLPWECAWADNINDYGLMDVPAFRRMLGRELEKTNDYVTFVWRDSDGLDYENTNSTGGFGPITLEGGPPPDGTTTKARWCDWIAFELSRKGGSSCFNPFSDVQKRDVAIRRTKAELLQR